MDVNQVVEKLMYFGLTRQEATIYLCLVQNGEMTGYEAAKQTGVSRSNAYNALAGLVDKGAAYTTEGTAIRYRSLDADEFCSNKIRCLQAIQEQIKKNLPKSKSEEEGYLTIVGDQHILDKGKNMILAAQERIYISMSKQNLNQFIKEIEQVVESGKKLVVLTEKNVPVEGILQYITTPREDQIGIITDSIQVLTGELGKGEESTCLFSGQKNFVKVFKDSLSNEIKLIQLVKGESK